MGRLVAGCGKEGWDAKEGTEGSLTVKHVTSSRHRTVVAGRGTGAGGLHGNPSFTGFSF